MFGKRRQAADGSGPRGRERDISRLVLPEVAVHQSRGTNAQRQVVRSLLRALSFATGDALGAMVALLALRAMLQHLPRSLEFGSRVVVGGPEFCSAVVLALLLTGNYRRSSPGHATLHLLVGSILGTLIVTWASLWGAHSIATAPIVMLLALGTACALFVTRGVLNAAGALLLPHEQRLVPAIVVVGGASMGMTLEPTSGYRVVGTVVLDDRHAESRTQQLARLIRSGRAEAVIVVGDVRSVLFAHLLEVALRAGCEVLCTPPGFCVTGVRATVVRRGAYNLVEIAVPSLLGPQVFAKRCVDVVGATVALVIALPLCLLIAVAIRLDSPGPVFFRQERVGLGGRRFRMIKFRTMWPGADQEKFNLRHLNVTGDDRLFKIKNDPRISRVGRVLRAWSLDELPQLLNVIGGSMSLVGPRPFFEEDFAAYEEHHFRRLGAKPGITGLWQVYGRSTVSDFEEVVKMDTNYIDNWSLWLDLKLLFLTIPAVVRRTGAY